MESTLKIDLDRIEEINRQHWPQVMAVLKEHAPELHTVYELVDIAERIYMEIRVEPNVRQVSISDIVSRREFEVQETPRMPVDPTPIENLPPGYLDAEPDLPIASIVIPLPPVESIPLEEDSVTPAHLESAKKLLDEGDKLRDEADDLEDEWKSRLPDKAPANEAEFLAAIEGAPVMLTPYEPETLIQVVGDVADYPDKVSGKDLMVPLGIPTHQATGSVIKWARYHADVIRGMRKDHRREYLGLLLKNRKDLKGPQSAKKKYGGR